MGKAMAHANITASLYDGEAQICVECRDNGRHCKYARYYTEPHEPGDDPACMNAGSACGHPLARREALLALREAVNVELALIASEFKEVVKPDTARRYRVTNGANGLFARLADITDDDGYANASILFVGTGASKFDMAEAQVVQMMCELHAERFKIVAWQGKFRIEEVRHG